MDVFSLPRDQQFLKPNWDRIVAHYESLSPDELQQTFLEIYSEYHNPDNFSKPYRIEGAKLQVLYNILEKKNIKIPPLPEITPVISNITDTLTAIPEQPE